MRNLMMPMIQQWRRMDLELQLYGQVGDHGRGFFIIPSPIDKNEIRIVASDGSGWDHVSVSRDRRSPNWPEMCLVKRLFFKDEETVMQLHVPEDDHLNLHPHCLHLWRPQTVEIPRPPSWMVALKGQKAPYKIRSEEE